MKIICGTDFSVHADAAALAAAALAARVQGMVSLVHVIDPSLYANPSEDLMNHLRNLRQKKLDQLVERVKRRAANVEASVVEGSPAAKLANLALEIDAGLLVVSSAGQIGPTQWFAGSVTDQAAQNSSTPTLVVRKAGAISDWAYSKRPLKVVIGYDFSASADAALHWAASLREIAPCEFTVAYVASAAKERTRLGIAPPLSPLYYPSGIKRFLEKELKQKCDSVLGEEGAKICVKADWGRPDSHLIEIAGENRADLLVVGTSQRRGLARLGSISRAVLHYAHMNVACVPTHSVTPVVSSELPRFNRVMVPIDFTASAEEAIALAYASVRGGGEVRLVHVTEPTHPHGTAVRSNGNGRHESRDVTARLEALIPKSAARRGITTRGEVVEHHEPAAAICEAAERFDADLICMGSRDRSAFRKTIFGSVSQDVLERSDRAVRVIHGNGRTQSAEASKHQHSKCEE